MGVLSQPFRAINLHRTAERPNCHYNFSLAQHCFRRLVGHIESFSPMRAKVAQNIHLS